MNTSRPSYLWSDAWLLAAICGASRDGAPTLARVIGMGAFINHAIFTLSELNGGLSRLRPGGLIQIRAGRYRLTSEGRAVTEMNSAQTVGPIEHMQQVRKRLAAPDWIPGLDPNAVDDSIDQTVHVSEEDFQWALDEYEAILKNPRKKEGEQVDASNEQRASPL